MWQILQIIRRKLILTTHVKFYVNVLFTQFHIYFQYGSKKFSLRKLLSLFYICNSFLNPVTIT